MHKVYPAIPFLLLILVLSCAKQTAPTGGPKDTIPPRMIEANPAKGATNIKQKSIELTFTETIILNNPKEQIIITPDINKKYDIKGRKKKVILTLEEDLKENTTYTFNFREAIQDITEKNPANNLKLAFSTGTYIDSLKIQGTVFDLIKNKEIKDATVALYEADTFNIFKHRPTYFTKANDKGVFQFDNLKHGIFYIYAFEDKNKNLIVDSKSESFGFKAQPLTLNESITDIDLHLIRLDTRPLKLTSARPSNTYYNIRSAKGLLDYRLNTDTGDSLLTIYGEDFANIKVYNTLENADSVRARLLVLDSIQNRIDTTLYVKFLDRKVTPEKFAVSIEQSRIITRTSILEVKGKYTKPIFAVNYDSINFHLDSANVVNFTAENLTLDNQKGIFRIRKELPKQFFQTKDRSTERQAPKKSNKPPGSFDINNTLKLGKGAFISAELDSSTVIEQKIRAVTEEESSVIKVSIQTAEPNYITQLVNKNGEVIQFAINNPKPIFYDITPGDYQLRLIIDTDNNKTWSPGNFFSKIEPEIITYYTNDKKSTTITLKPNWELGPLLITF